jgi:hypothetical protein
VEFVHAMLAFQGFFKSAAQITQEMGPADNKSDAGGELSWPSPEASSVGLTGKFHSTIMTLSKLRFGGPSKQKRLPVLNRQSPPLAAPCLNGQSRMDVKFGVPEPDKTKDQ